MSTYNYNKKFIEQLNLYELEKREQLDNQKYNKAIFFALSSIKEHTCKNNNIQTRQLLLGDYYSFEYYSLLSDDLNNLETLTTVMKNCYKGLANKTLKVEEVFVNIIEVWFQYYGKKLEEEDRYKIIQKIKMEI